MQYAMFFHNTIWILSFKILKVHNKTFFGDSVFSFFSEFDIYNGKIPPEFLYFRAHAYWVLLYWPPFLPKNAHASQRLMQWAEILSEVA